jgi:hypothetical protein
MNSSQKLDKVDYFRLADDLPTTVIKKRNITTVDDESQRLINFQDGEDLWKKFETYAYSSTWASIDYSEFVDQDLLTLDATIPLTLTKAHVGYFTHFSEFFDSISRRIIDYLSANHILSCFPHLQKYNRFCANALMYLTAERRYICFLRDHHLYLTNIYISKLEMLFVRFYRYSVEFIRINQENFVAKVDPLFDEEELSAVATLKVEMLKNLLEITKSWNTSEAITQLLLSCINLYYDFDKCLFGVAFPVGR